MFWVPLLTVIAALTSDTLRHRPPVLRPPIGRLSPIEPQHDLVVRMLRDLIHLGVPLEVVDLVGELALGEPLAHDLTPEDHEALAQRLEKLELSSLDLRIRETEPGWWTAKVGRWFVTMEPWCPRCLDEGHGPYNVTHREWGHGQVVPDEILERIRAYEREARVRGQMLVPGHIDLPPVPRHAELYAEVWAPSDARAREAGYDIVQLQLWKLVGS
jgi:hypothetical protein